VPEMLGRHIAHQGIMTLFYKLCSVGKRKGTGISRTGRFTDESEHFLKKIICVHCPHQIWSGVQTDTYPQSFMTLSVKLIQLEYRHFNFGKLILMVAILLTSLNKLYQHEEDSVLSVFYKW
jgi:hypothetical protein